MAIVGLFTWWYSGGLRRQWQLLLNRLAGTYDYFSIDLLMRSLFAPYRQISAAQIDGSLQVRFHAFIDRLISRIIGAAVRTIMILTGVISLVVSVLFGGVIIAFWVIAPLLPVVGIALSMSGWVPWKL